jgi:hypothetical protein
MKTKLAAVLIFLMLLSTSIPLMMIIKPVSAPTVIPILAVDPDYVLGGEVGSEFSIDVTMNDLDVGWNCSSVQFRLLYDDALLEVTDVVEGPFMATFNETYFFYVVEDWPPYGPNVLVGVLLQDYPPFASGTGTLATITFKVLFRPVAPEEAGCDLTLNETQMLDLTGEIPVEIPHTTVHGYYEAWQAQTSLWVDPDYVLGGVIGSEFSVDVKLHVLNTSQEVVAVQFRLQYDEMLLEYVSDAEGPFMGLFPNAEEAPYTFYLGINEEDPDFGWNVLVGNLIYPNRSDGTWYNFPVGSGTISTITFRVLSRPVAPDTASCLLKLVDTQVLNSSIEDIEHIAYHGEYEASPILMPTLSVDPNPVVGGVIGSEFDVNVTMNDLDLDWNCSIIEFRLPYCGDLLEFVSAVEGPFMGTAGATWFSYIHEDWPPYGLNVLVGNMMQPPWTTFPSGTGTVATITFKVLDRPIAPDIMWCLLNLEETLVLDKEVEEIPHYATGSLYKALQIFPPTLKVEPPLVELMTAYQLFDINVTMNDLDADWNCTIVEFKLVYNGTLLEAVDVVEGSFPPQFGDTLFINHTEQFAGRSYVLVGILWWDPSPFPHGTSTLATITFNATYQGRDPLVELESDLALEETLMLDEYWNVVVSEIPHYTEDGHYIIYSTHFADVNRDGKVDMRDIGAIALAFGTSPEYPGEPPRWNPAYDVNYDGKIDMKDVALAARNFGWPYT